jgi:predicted TPR repeat methyltransferase
MSKELDEVSRMKRVDAAIASAEDQIKANDVYAAMKTVDSALRLDPTNETLKKMMIKVQPLFDKAEKARLSKLDSKERLKEEGDTKFKAADFEGAIKAYTKCLDAISDKVHAYVHIHSLIQLNTPRSPQN